VCGYGGKFLASFGMSGACVAVLREWMCTTRNETVTSTRQWAHTVDGDGSIHRLAFMTDLTRITPKIMLMKNMTEEEELEYISKRYVPDKDWETEPKKKKK